jgi:copper chaperone CopZ
MKKTVIIEGMDTLQKGRAISDIIGSISGVGSVKLNLDEQAVIVEFGRGVLTEDELCDALSDEGFEVSDIFDA